MTMKNQAPQSLLVGLDTEKKEQREGKGGSRREEESMDRVETMEAEGDPELITVEDMVTTDQDTNLLQTTSSTLPSGKSTTFPMTAQRG